MRLESLLKKFKLGIEKYNELHLKYIQPQLSRIEVFLRKALDWNGKWRLPFFVSIYIFFLLEMPRTIISITIFGFVILPFISAAWALTFRTTFFAFWTIASVHDFFYFRRYD